MFLCLVGVVVLFLIGELKMEMTNSVKRLFCRIYQSGISLFSKPKGNVQIPGYPCIVRGAF